MCIRDRNLEGWKVTNPVDESRRIIDKIKDQVDVLIGVMHMDTENEYGVYGSGVTDLANACPEFDVIVGGHGHRKMCIRDSVMTVQTQVMRKVYDPDKMRKEIEAQIAEKKKQEKRGVKTVSYTHLLPRGKARHSWRRPAV